MSNHNVHKVSSDALETLGTIIDERAGRDAIHVAVEPCKAGELLHAGQHVKLLNGGFAHAPFMMEDCVGIVDPFLRTPVQPGQWFWMLLYPRTITSLRHVWSHPAFEDKEPAAPDKAESEAWLRDFCDNYDAPDYDHLIEAASGYDGDEYLLIDGQDASGDIPDEVWYHLEIVMGTRFKTRAKYFSCSC